MDSHSRNGTGCSAGPVSYTHLWPDVNYIMAGSNDTKVMGLSKVGEYLGIVKEGAAADSTIYLAYPTTFDEETAYATKQSVTCLLYTSRCV